MTHALRFRAVAATVWLTAASVLTGCATVRAPGPPDRAPTVVRAEIVRLMPAEAADRNAWARDIYAAFATQHIPQTTDNLCAVLAVTAQESSFNADPAVPHLGRIARDEIERRAAAAHVPDFMLNAALSMTSDNGQSYRERLESVHTEGQLSALYGQFIEQVPLGDTLFGSFNPVHTGGPMQVSVAFAAAHDEDYPYPIDGSIRQEVFTRRGGLYFGVQHLLGYAPDYPRPLYRFADYNAGRYASRNAAFQAAVSRVSGIPLALDGDLIQVHAAQAGATERAVRTLGKRLELDDADIYDDLKQQHAADFSETRLYKRLFTLADTAAQQALPRALVPEIALKSPKITRKLTTSWFAHRVNTRWQRCMRRADAADRT